MYFVTYFGDIQKDPLDKGVNAFPTINDANTFANTQENKGYSVSIYAEPNSQFSEQMKQKAF